MKTNSYEILLKQMKKYELSGAVVNFTGDFLMVLSIVWGLVTRHTIDMGEVGGYGIFFLLFVGFFLISLGAFISDKAEPLKTAYVYEYRNDIVAKTLDGLFDSVAYNSGSGFSRQYIEDMDLLKIPVATNSNFSSGNYIHASYKGISWKYGDIRIWGNQGSYSPWAAVAAELVWILRKFTKSVDTTGDANTNVFFDGCVLEIAYPIPSTARLKIYSHSFPNIKGGWHSSKREKRQETGDENFDRKFLVKCNSDADFRNIVTPEMKEKLEIFHNLYNEFALEIEQGKIYILLAGAGGAFVPDFSQEMDVAHETRKIKGEMQVLTDAIDIFCREVSLANRGQI